MLKQNCWEVKNCDREPNGIKVALLGECPAAIDVSSNGLNSGKNGGRLCWAITGTMCGGKVQGTFAEKKLTCLSCDFFRQVKTEENSKFRQLKPGQTFKPHK